ncbi:MAG: ATP-binding protein [Nitrospirota bacterium]|nr:ATP-binding protein [Nitrospirota bacterium]
MPAETCHRHGCVLQFETISALGESYRMGSGCSLCDEESARKSEDEEAHRRKITFSRAQVSAGIPARYRSSVIGQFPIPANGQQEVLDAAKHFVGTSGANSTGLIFMGKVGTGKSHLACALLSEFLKKGLVCQFLSATQAFRLIKECWARNADKTENQAIRSFTTPHLLVLDEVGVQKDSATEYLFLNEIVNERYNAMRPTILLTNLTMEEFTKLLGDRIVDRFREGGHVLVFDWDSQRQRGNK